MALCSAPGFSVTHTLCSKLTLCSKPAVSLKSAQQSIQSNCCKSDGLKKRFFQAIGTEPVVISDNAPVL
jgi:hypothetical protein